MEADRVTRAVARMEAEGTNTLHHNLVRFVQILRHLGVRVSIAEALDACQALADVDLMHRTQVKAALRALLIKDRADRAVFDLAFERFFAPAEEKKRRREQYRRWEEEQRQKLEQAAEELNETVARWLPDVQFSTEQVATFARLPDEQRRRFAEIMGRMRGNPVNDPGELIARVVESSLNYWRYYMMKNQQGDMPLENGPDEIIDGVAADFYRDPEEQLLHRDMQQIADREVERIADLIRRLSLTLAGRLSRRYRYSRRRRLVDIRRTIRRNLSYGGAPFKLSFRSRQAHKPRLLLICDVSASMARYARFVLQFVYGLSSAVREIESFVFSEDLERVTPYFRHGRGFAETMTALVNESRQWGLTTNFGAALQTFLRLHRPLLHNDTRVFVVSDTRTVAPRSAAVELAAVRRHVKEIIWLNTVPEGEWDRLPGVRAFLEHARMVECRTLYQLESILRRELKKL